MLKNHELFEVLKLQTFFILQNSPAHFEIFAEKDGCLELIV